MLLRCKDCPYRVNEPAGDFINAQALYIMYDDWAELSKLTRRALRATRSHGEDFVRVIHRPGWEAKVRLLIISRHGKPSQN